MINETLRSFGISMVISTFASLLFVLTKLVDEHQMILAFGLIQVALLANTRLIKDN